MSFALIPNHSPEHMAKMARAAGQGRTFTEAEQAWIREHWVAARTIEGMAAHLKCRTTVLKREAKLMGLPKRGPYRRPKRVVPASERLAPRKYNKGCERVKDIDGEKSSPPPAGILYACPGCGMRSTDPLGHANHRAAA
jgi:dihydrodipicolinate synthase/N-acetylneuraminate lyase